MELFYKNLAEGMTKAEALRQAKLSLLQQKPDFLEASSRGGLTVQAVANPTPRSLSHPYYWSPFILIGNGL